MGLDISEKIEKLPEEKQTEFNDEFFDDCVNDREWCRTHHIDYVNPDMKKAKEILFTEKYAKYISA